MKESKHYRKLWYHLSGEFRVYQGIITLDNEPGRLFLSDVEDPNPKFRPESFITYDENGKPRVVVVTEKSEWR